MLKQFDSITEFSQSQYADWVNLEDFTEGFTEEQLAQPCTFVAYTDYGGDFIDRTASKFIQEFANSDTYTVRNTVYYGENLLYIGCQEDEYPLSDFTGINKNFEDYYSQKEWECNESEFKRFVDETYNDFELPFDRDELMYELSEKFYGNYAPLADGTLDVCWSTFKEFADQWIGEQYVADKNKSEDVPLPGL
jgi:hypothetical protein